MVLQYYNCIIQLRKFNGATTMTKKTFFIAVLGILLASCSITTLEEQQVSEDKGNRKNKYYYTLDSNITDANLDNDFMSKYKEIVVNQQY